MPDENVYDVMGKYLSSVDIGVAGARGLQPPSVGFDPRSADRLTLMRHGLLPRPDPALYSRAAAIWDRLAGQNFEYVLPRLTPRSRAKDKSAKLKPFPQRPLDTSTDRYSPNWSGGVIFNTNTASDPFKSVYGEWTVPSVVPPTNGDGDWWSLAWIGADGYNENDVMQVGTGHHVTRTDSVVSTEYFAWVEWYSYSWNTVSLTVNPGDYISANISNVGAQNGVLQATGRITNVTTGQTTAVAVSAPPGTIFQGDVVEWIMERPSFNGVLTQLPRFGQVAFSDVLACTSNSQAYYASQGLAVNMTSDGTASGTRYASSSAQAGWNSEWFASS